jgi:hypothetical protein
MMRSGIARNRRNQTETAEKRRFGFPSQGSRVRAPSSALPASLHGKRDCGSREAAAKRGYVRVWSWPIPPDTYVDPEVVHAYLDEEASRGAPVGPPES